MFVEVIVDVNTSQLDKEYVYKVPAEYKNENLLGYRVEVPFGTRIVQGYVVSRFENYDGDISNFKYIKRVKDAFPILTRETLLLSKVMARELFCTRIQVIETIVPAILKNKYVEYYKLLDANKNLLLNYEQYFKNGLVEKKVLEKKLSEKEIAHLVYIKAITLISKIKERKNVDFDKYIVLNDANNKKITKKGQIVVDYLNENKEIKESEVKNKLNVGQAVIKRLLNDDVIVIKLREKKTDSSDLVYINKNTLSEEQQKIYDRVANNFQRKKFGEYLLHGVTGSGKTEIYLKLVEENLKLGKEAIVLVPEIILTPQIEKKFKKAFGNNIAIIHSRLSAREKFEQWKKIKDGKVKICLGTRSAIFAPFEKLGLIIIDEEHESSYKQVDSPKYETKDIAKKRAIYNKATLLYASATPSIDLYYRFETFNKDNLLKLMVRYGNKLPEMKIIHTIDKEEIISDELIAKIKEKIAKGEQVILLANKRGYTNFIRCFNCGHMYNCENCDVSLNFHKFDNALHCHLCGFKKKVSAYKKCCESPHLVSGNYGIQRVEEYLLEHIEDAKITRMDTDTTGRKGAYEKLLTEFREHKTNILLGTQMISKGLDFPDVTLVGILSIDSLLAIPSFKANEKLFQLLVQTAGRAGRSDKEGEVYLQTNVASNVIDYAMKHDYMKFYHYELNRRKIVNYPPFCNMSFITIKGFDENKVNLAARSIYNFLKDNYDKDKILGPNKSLFYKVNNEYSYNIIIRFDDSDTSRLFKALKYINDYFTDSYGVEKIAIAIDNSAQDYM